MSLHQTLLIQYIHYKCKAYQEAGSYDYKPTGTQCQARYPCGISRSANCLKVIIQRWVLNPPLSHLSISLPLKITCNNNNFNIFTNIYPQSSSQLSHNCSSAMTIFNDSLFLTLITEFTLAWEKTHVKLILHC